MALENSRYFSARLALTLALSQRERVFLGSAIVLVKYLSTVNF